MPIITGKPTQRQPRTPPPTPQYTGVNAPYVLEMQRLIALHLHDCEELYGANSDTTRRLTGLITENAIQIARLWDQMTIDNRERFGFHRILGTNDPQATSQDVLAAMYENGNGLSRIVPYPDGWQLSRGNLRRAFDTSVAPSSVSMRSIMESGST